MNPITYIPQATFARAFVDNYVADRMKKGAWLWYNWDHSTKAFVRIGTT